MRRILLLLILLCTTFSYAQDGSFGIKVGANFSKLTGDNTENIDGRTSFVAGGLAVIPLKGKLFLQPEVLYASKGFVDTTEQDDIDARLNYLNFNVLFKYKFTEQISLELGPQLGLLLAAKASQESRNDEDISELFTGRDFGWHFGLTFKVYQGLHLGAGYDLGLSNINDQENNENKLKNSAFQINLSYVFKS